MGLFPYVELVFSGSLFRPAEVVSFFVEVLAVPLIRIKNLFNMLVLQLLHFLVEIILLKYLRPLEPDMMEDDLVATLPSLNQIVCFDISIHLPHDLELRVIEIFVQHAPGLSFHKLFTIETCQNTSCFEHRLW